MTALTKQQVHVIASILRANQRISEVSIKHIDVGIIVDCFAGTNNIFIARHKVEPNGTNIKLWDESNATNYRTN